MGVGWVGRYAGASVGIGKCCVRVLGAGSQQLRWEFLCHISCCLWPGVVGHFVNGC